MDPMTIEFGSFVRITRAVQYDGDNAADVIEYLQGKLGPTAIVEKNTAGAIVNDVCAVNVGDYVLAGPGTPGFGVVSEQDFERDFELLDGPAPEPVAPPEG